MSDYAKALGQRLRTVRNQQGLSLLGVEEKSEGRWKAVVIGSYERGDRAVSVQKLAQLAEFYSIPIAELLPDARPVHRGDPATKVVLNLVRLRELPVELAGPLNRYVATIQSQRGDYNGRVLSIRSEDLKTLAIIYDITPPQMSDQLVSWGVLARDTDSLGEVQARRLQDALDGSAALQQARGVFAERTGLKMDEAIALLREYAREHNLALDDAASAIAGGSLAESRL